MNRYTYLEYYVSEGPSYFWFKSHYIYAFNALIRGGAFHSSNLKAIDIGSGEGFFANYLHKEKLDFLILNDYDLPPLKRAIKIHNDLGCASDICNLPYASGSFNLVCALDVIEHIKDDKKALDEIYRVLKPGGYFLITVPAFNFLWGEHDEFNGHYRRYSKKEITEKMVQSCFKVVWNNYAKSIAFFPMLIFRFLKKITRKSKSTMRPDIFNLPKIFNRLFCFLLCLEMPLFKFTKIPFGVTFICLGKRENEKK